MSAPTYWPEIQHMAQERSEQPRPPELGQLIRDYGMDSLDQYELGYFIEEEYEIQFTDTEITDWQTFRDVLNTVRGKCAVPVELPPQIDMLPTLARAFGVDPDRLEAIVAAYENPDRLTLIEACWREAGYALNEAGCEDGDVAWLIEQVKKLRKAIEEHRLVKWGDLPVDKPHDLRLYAVLRP